MIYVRESPRKNTSKEQCTAKHNATANRVLKELKIKNDENPY